MPAETLIITGGAGFIGSNLVRQALDHTADRLVVVDKLTYAGSRSNLAGVLDHPRIALIEADIADRAAMEQVFAAHRPRALVNLAAESHVDRSIHGPRSFIDTNVVGTSVLLECARTHVAGEARRGGPAFRFLHVSTDEVYGTLGPTGRFREDSRYAPNSPYAASKAAADHLARAWFHTYGLPVLITHCSNNYGAYQFPEKLIPLMILNALDGRPLPIYGDGGHVRDWLHVEDHCAALLRVLSDGTPGERYNIGGGNERSNLEIVDLVCDSLDDLRPAPSNPALNSRASYRTLKTFVPDRPGHDRRYAIDASRIVAELGWSPRRPFRQGLHETVRWYVEHRDWCSRRLRIGDTR